MSEQSITYADLQAGDVIEVKINAPLFPQIHGNWERREIVAVDGATVRMRDGDREYDIDPALDAGRQMRRCPVLHFYPGTALGRPPSIGDRALCGHVKTGPHDSEETGSHCYICTAFEAIGSVDLRRHGKLGSRL